MLNQKVKIIAGANAGKTGIVQKIDGEELKIRLIACAVYALVSQVEVVENNGFVSYN